MANPLPAFDWQEMKNSSLHPTQVSRAQTLRSSRRGSGAQQYSGVIRSSPLTRDEAMDLDGFLDALRGRLHAFDFTLPVLSTGRGSLGNAGLVPSSVAAGMTVIPFTGPANLTAAFKRGDFLTFAGDLKVYRAAADAPTNASGEGVVRLAQHLRQALAPGTAITTEGVRFTAIKTDDATDLKVGAGLVEIEIPWEEAL